MVIFIIRSSPTGTGTTAKDQINTPMKELKDIRIDYSKYQLGEAMMPQEPFALLTSWFEDAIRSDEREPTAMALSTVSAAGSPSTRIVLLKDLRAQSLVFYTNYQSQKGQELALNPRASAVFFWPSLERQLRIEGMVKKLSDNDSDAYFNSRPLESRISAAISPQSMVITGREELEKSFKREIKKAKKGAMPLRPNHWGGYCLNPKIIEFWQGRPGRLHDRFRYSLLNNRWSKARLAP